MQIDPHGWLLALPLVASMVWVYFQPAEHLFKQAWRELARMEAMGLSVLMIADFDRDPGQARTAHHVIFWVIVSLFALAGAMSLAAFIGLI